MEGGSPHSTHVPMFNPRPYTPAWWKAHPTVQNALLLRGKRAKAIVGSKKRRITGLRPEVKYYENYFAGAIAAGGVVYNTTYIAEGTDFNTRVGRLINALYVQVDIWVKAPTNNATPDTGICAVVVDRQSNSSTPNVSDIFDNTTLRSGQQFKKLSSNSERFVILKTKTFGPLDHTASIDNSRHRFMVKIPKRLCRVRYSGSSAGVPESNAIFLICHDSNDGGATDTSMNWLINYRCAFVDA